MSQQSSPSRTNSIWVSARHWWERIATVFAVIGLVDLAGQLIKWAAAIHWVVTQYGAAKQWAFDWLPFRVPYEWRDYIVLLCLLLSVTSIGFYQKTGQHYVMHLIRVFTVAVVGALITPLALVDCTILKLINLRATKLLQKMYDFVEVETFLKSKFESFLMIVMTSVYIVVLSIVAISPLLVSRNILAFMNFPFVVGFAVLFGAFLAWRWMLVTAAVFTSLVAINAVYTNWLEPLVYTH